MAVELAPLLLSSRPEVESIFSADGIDLRIDDDDDLVTDGEGGTANDEQFLIDALIEASDEGYMRLQVRYDDDVLADSLWVRRRASYIACHILSTRKGNPAQYCAQYERYLKDFDKVAKGGEYFIPRVKPRANFQPTMSNMAITHWHGVAKIRVLTTVSEGPEDGRQFVDNVHFGFRGFWF